MNAGRVVTETLAGPLAVIKQSPLRSVPNAQVAKIVRRIVDNESLAPQLDVAAFNSAP